MHPIFLTNVVIMQFKQAIFQKITFFFLLFLSSCVEEYESLVPDTSFQVQVNLNIYNKLLIPGEAEFFSTGGYSGIWVMHSPALASENNPFIAFDACCPYEAERSIRIVSKGAYAQCDSCHTMYNWQMDGSTIAGDSLGGPGTQALRSYAVSKAGSMLTIFN